MESSGGSGGWELQGLNAMVLPVGTVAEESTGEEHGLKAGGWVHGWDKGDSRGIPESIRTYRDCVVTRDWRNFWGTKRHDMEQDENRMTAQGKLQPGWVLRICFYFPSC